MLSDILNCSLGHVVLWEQTLYRTSISWTLFYDCCYEAEPNRRTDTRDLPKKEGRKRIRCTGPFHPRTTIFLSSCRLLIRMHCFRIPDSLLSYSRSMTLYRSTPSDLPRLKYIWSSWNTQDTAGKARPPERSVHGWHPHTSLEGDIIPIIWKRRETKRRT